MQRENFLRPCRLYLVACLFMLVCLTGCINPQSEVAPGAKLESYRKIYLLEPNNDDRGVGELIRPRLGKAGFKVTAVKSEDDPVESQGTGFVISPEGNV